MVMRSSSGTKGMFAVSTFIKMTRWCSTWLCFRLCSNDTGAMWLCGTIKMAVPLTRCGSLLSKVSKNSSKGIELAQRALSKRSRPVIQQIIIANRVPATLTGSQPPSKNLNKLVPKNTQSRPNNTANNGINSALLQPLTKIMK